MLLACPDWLSIYIHLESLFLLVNVHDINAHKFFKACTVGRWLAELQTYIQDTAKFEKLRTQNEEFSAEHFRYLCSFRDW